MGRIRTVGKNVQECTKMGWLNLVRVNCYRWIVDGLWVGLHWAGVHKFHMLEMEFKGC
jgi:hypothetical protein